MRSIYRSADDPTRIEFCVRFQENDPNLKRDLRNVESLGWNVRTHVGPAYEGYKSNHLHFQEAYALATGQWTWMMNDDCTVRGQGWDTRLAAIQDNRFLVPAIHKLGESTYQNDPDCGALIVPLYAIKDIGTLQGPPDKYIRDTLRARGFLYQFLDVTFHHHRETDAERAAHYGSLEAATY